MFNKKLKVHFHWPLLWTTLALVFLGFINLYSATYSYSVGFSPKLITQLIAFLIGSILVLVSLYIDYRVYIRLSYAAYALAIMLLLLVVFFGKEVDGNRNWLKIGAFSFQPSEYAKLAFILVMARYLSDHPSFKGYRLQDLIRPVLLLLPVLGLILAGKDIGTSLFLMATFASMILFAGVRRNVVILGLVLSLVGGYVAYHKFLSGKQKARITSFLNQDADPKGRNYHLIQSKIAVGSGQVFGKGYLKGMQNKLLYLPDKHTDFIFPVLAEEWGLVGCLVVLGLYLTILIYSVQLASRAKERFGVFLAMGIAAFIFWQLVINLGGVLGIIPLTGITLPLLSYGGTSMISILLSIGMLLNISMRRFMF